PRPFRRNPPLLSCPPVWEMFDGRHMNKACARLRILSSSLLLMLLLGGGSPARAQTNVDLQLVLAVDASGSVNDTRFELQKQGYAAAFRHPRVLSAIRQGAQQSIAAT